MSVCVRVRVRSYACVYVLVYMRPYIGNGFIYCKCFNFIENYLISLVGILFLYVNKYPVANRKGNKYVIGSQKKVHFDFSYSIKKNGSNFHSNVFW